MENLNLTQAEIDLILRNREIANQKVKNHEFHKQILKTTYEWLEWSDNNGKAGLTFSTFVNEFGFDGEYKSVYFNAIGDVLKFLKDYQAPKG